MLLFSSGREFMRESKPKASPKPPSYGKRQVLAAQDNIEKKCVCVSCAHVYMYSCTLLFAACLPACMFGVCVCVCTYVCVCTRVYVCVRVCVCVCVCVALFLCLCLLVCCVCVMCMCARVCVVLSIELIFNSRIQKTVYLILN